MQNFASTKSIFYLLLFIATTFLVNLEVSTRPGGMLVAASKKTDILFLKGKFILKDKKGAIVISDDKKPCECSHYYR